MRNLKKTLCLVLALVFVLGLCTVGAADVQFDDENEITYETAVKAMAGLGILKGDDRDNDGKMEFRPKDGLTRAEAAKIISYVVLGPSIENWPARQVFDDVSADHWAAKYISYCYHNGIINGVGGNKFDPDSKVSRVAVAKMLLAACGYGAKDEFVGADWDFNVLTTANQTKLLQGLAVVSIDGEATREETAMMAYNAMMNVIMVVLEKNTNSYVPETVNGKSIVTLAETAWGIRTSTGVITANKTNSASAKGTVLSGEGVLSYYVTEEDENPDILGHEVTITYRFEAQGSADVPVAYFIDDQCTEVKGADAANAGEADTVYTFSSGRLVSNTVPAKAARASSPGTFVLNKEGKIVAYKTEGFFVSVLSISSSGQASVVDPATGLSVPVPAVAGAKSGDIVTVTHMGDIYSAKAVNVVRLFISVATYDAVKKTYTYNDGAVIPSNAELLNVTVLPNITKLDGSVNQLEVGSTYTLYIDSEGGCIGFSDKSGSGSTVSSGDYAMLITTFTRDDNYGEKTYYAQVVRGNGEKSDLRISKATYESTLYNTVYRLSASGGVYALNNVSSEELAYEKYSEADPLTVFTNATYIWYNGVGNSLQVDLRQKPLSGAYVYFTFSLVKDGTTWVRRVQSVWFQASNTNPVPVSNSYIYVPSVTPNGRRLINGVARDTYEGYLNGAVLNDLALSAAPAKAGIATYSKSGDVYTLSFLNDEGGLKTGARTVVLEDNGQDVMLINPWLYVKDSAGKLQKMDFTGVKFVVVGSAKASGLTLDSYNALVKAASEGKKITLTFVEVVSGETHSIGGGVIYVTEVN